jgi:uncharacterized protein (DUF486 family)
VPANRIGFRVMTFAQPKILQGRSPGMAPCILGAVYFIFRG